MSSEIAKAADAPASADRHGEVIRADGLSKCYQIYERPQDRLKQSLSSRLHALVGQRAPKYYEEFWALKDVGMEVRRGETVGIIGRNGSGKSTLLQILCGTLSPTAGTVEVRGRVAALLELGSGFNPDFTGRENIYMNAAVLGLDKARIDERFEDIVRFADIGDFIEQPVKTYSSGMVVRLAFAVIAHVDADILIVDEALAVGDAFFTQKCMRFLRTFQAHGTLVFVSHDIGAVTGLCERAIWLEGGKVVADGPAKDVMNDYLEAFSPELAGSARKTASVPADPVHQAVPRDVRQDLIDRSLLRNDIQVPPFDPGKDGFGSKGARVVDVALLDAEGRQLPTIAGGELVVLEIVAAAHEPVANPILGFYVKDRLGQLLFGDNTYLTGLGRSLALLPGQRIAARFTFAMPRLQHGDYFITAGIADGTQAEHRIEHWIHEALLLKSVSGSTHSGIIGLPIHGIELGIQDS